MSNKIYDELKEVSEKFTLDMLIDSLAEWETFEKFVFVFGNYKGQKFGGLCEYFFVKYSIDFVAFHKFLDKHFDQYFGTYKFFSPDDVVTRLKWFNEIIGIFADHEQMEK